VGHRRGEFALDTREIILRRRLKAAETLAPHGRSKAKGGVEARAATVSNPRCSIG
jgi:hypothetical protein